MLRRLSLFLALAALVVSACDDADVTPPLAPEAEAPLAGPGFQQAPAFVPGRVLARFAPGAAAADLAGQQGATVQRTIALGIRVLSVPQGAEARVAAALARNPNVEFAEPDLIYTFGDPAVMPVDDPFIGFKWDLDNDGDIYDSGGSMVTSTGEADADMDWREAVESLGAVSGSARIGIMDSGIRNDHEELAGRIVAQFDFFAGDDNAEDDNGHGTHVAGIAAADTDNGVGVAGVAFAGNVEFVIAKVCGPTGWGPFVSYGCPSSAIVDGIEFAVDNGANVLNLSLGGGGGSSAQQAALQYARDNGVLPFCAAGNDAGQVSFPGAFPECVAVSATDWGDELASYSNFGPEVEISAPGGDFESSSGYSYIASSYYESPSSYVFMAGTSMATPQAAGLGALLHVLGVTDDGDKLVRMKSTADDLGASGTDNQFGAGRINVFAAVDGLGDGGGGTNSPPDASFSPPSCTTGEACAFDGSASDDSDGSIDLYEWAFGDGGSATGVNASHMYAAAGDYTVTLTVTDDDSATGSESHTVTVTDPGTNSPPDASFSPPSCTTGEACAFDGSASDDSDGSIDIYEWAFGDGGSATGVNASHAYTTAGDYTVTLTVTDDDSATDSESHTVTVSDPSPAGLTLTATGYKVRGQHHIDLEWSGASSEEVDILLGGSVIDTVGSDGFSYTHSTSNRGPGSYVFRVCEAGTTTCSDAVTVSF